MSDDYKRHNGRKYICGAFPSQAAQAVGRGGTDIYWVMGPIVHQAEQHMVRCPMHCLPHKEKWSWTWYMANSASMGKGSKLWGLDRGQLATRVQGGGTKA